MECVQARRYNDATRFIVGPPKRRLKSWIVRQGELREQQWSERKTEDRVQCARTCRADRRNATRCGDNNALRLTCSLAAAGQLLERQITNRIQPPVFVI